MRDYLEAKHVLAVSSCTAALHLSLVALGVGPGDEVITTLDHLAGDRERDRPLRRDARVRRHPRRHAEHRPGARARARQRAHEGDHARRPLRPARRSRRAASALGLPVVEDAAHAAESRYRGRKVGSISDLTCFSLYATKNIAAGEGGLIATNRDDLAEALDDLRVMRRGHGSLYDIAVPGYKANLSDVLASIALVQLDKVERARRDPPPPRRDLRRGHRRPRRRRGRSRATRATSHANHLYVVRVTFADRDDGAACARPTRTSARRSTSCPCTG